MPTRLLRDLLPDVGPYEMRGDPAVEVTFVTHDSRRVRPGSVFSCVPGSSYDGHDFAAEAVGAGAAALLVAHFVDLPGAAVPQVRVGDPRATMGMLAAALHGHPSRAMRVLGVTGTNGKTTTTYLIESVANAAGLATGVIGTVEIRVREAVLPAERTTPESTDLQDLLAGMRDEGVELVAMEVSSHALSLHRVDGTRFAAACFTNLSREHLDFHGAMEHYLEAKLGLFDPDRSAAAAVNLDDEVSSAVVRRAESGGLEVMTFGLASAARVSARALHPTSEGTRFTLWFDGVDLAEIDLSLVGAFNVSNALAAAATALVAGLGAEAVVAGLGRKLVVPGRFEAILPRRSDGSSAGPRVFVDYAHTPDALRCVLDAARQLATPAGGRVTVVFGCGGDRDRGKRAAMGEVAGDHADVVVVTSDNPRGEEPGAIVAEVLQGLRGAGARVTVDLERRAAIEAAILGADDTDIVILAGKGHEQGQTAGGVTVPFDDRLVAREILERRVCA